MKFKPAFVASVKVLVVFKGLDLRHNLVTEKK